MDSFIFQTPDVQKTPATRSAFMSLSRNELQLAEPVNVKAQNGTDLINLDDFDPIIGGNMDMS